MSDDIHDGRLAKALARYQIISAYVADPPARGNKMAFIKHLSQKSWTGPDGEPMHPAPDTIRVWIRRYRLLGLEGLMGAKSTRLGTTKLTDEQQELLLKLKKEVPERSIERIIDIAEKTNLVSSNILKRSTVHRVLKAHGISARKAKTPDAQDLDRFEADAPNALWQSDMLVGPYLPDPQKSGKSRRVYLYLFMDDHSRIILHGRFGFKGDLPALELVFKRALQKYGICKRVYYDNGQTYRSHHMKHIVASLGIHRLIFTTPYRPQGHGKIESLNGYIRNAFLSELKVAQITTIDQLNEAFLAWSDYEYNQRIHSEIAMKPKDRWFKGVESIRYADEELLRTAFLWREKRTPDKTGIFSLFNVRYQVASSLARKRIEIRYDPEDLHQIEIWHNNKFFQRLNPFMVSSHRRPKPKASIESKTFQNDVPTANWLGHLVERRKEEGFIEPSPKALANQAKVNIELQNEAIIELLLERLDKAVIDELEIRQYLNTFGPFDPDTARFSLDYFLEHTGRKDHHIRLYLDIIRNDQKEVL